MWDVSESQLNANDISEALAELGIRSGDSILVHSSLSSIGRVVGGAEAVIQGMMDLVGPQGTLLMPVMPDTTVPFSPESSPSVVGRVTETMRRMPGVVRSNHPTHSVAAWGARAVDLTAGHDKSRPCGLDSPYGKLCAVPGWVLLLGVDQDRNTSWHLAEDVADVPYLTTKTALVAYPGGEAAPFRMERSPGGHREFIKWDRRLYEAGVMRIGRVGQAEARLMRADRLLEFGLQRLQEDPAAFLCDKPRCVYCLWARARIEQTADERSWANVSEQWGCGDPRCVVCYAPS